MSNNFDETFPRPQAGPFGVVREDGDQERVTVLVAAFEGWNDAGDAATDAVQFLATHYGAKDVFEVTSDDYYDYQFSRPLVRRGATGYVKIVLPTTRLSTATVQQHEVEVRAGHGGGGEPGRGPDDLHVAGRPARTSTSCCCTAGSPPTGGAPSPRSCSSRRPCSTSTSW